MGSGNTPLAQLLCLLALGVGVVCASTALGRSSDGGEPPRAPAPMPAVASQDAVSPSGAGGSLAVEQVDPGEYQWRGSVSLGKPWKGSLFRGVQLPAEGEDFFTWDFPLRTSPNRDWRRWGADRTINLVLRVLAEYREAHPEAPRVGIADISRPLGGSFGRRFGGLGHASHQNGTDVDILYPRRDRLELEPTKVGQVDTVLSQDLVDRFVAAGAQYVFVGPRTKLTGPRKTVEKLVHHDNHLHVRFFNRGVIGG